MTVNAFGFDEVCLDADGAPTFPTVSKGIRIQVAHFAALICGSRDRCDRGDARAVGGAGRRHDRGRQDVDQIDVDVPPPRHPRFVRPQLLRQQLVAVSNSFSLTATSLSVHVHNDMYRELPSRAEVEPAAGCCGAARAGPTVARRRLISSLGPHSAPPEPPRCSGQWVTGRVR